MRHCATSRYVPQNATAIEYPEVGAVAYVENIGDKLYAMGYHGKRNNHDFYYQFRSPEARSKYIADWAEGLRQYAAMMAERKASRSAGNDWAAQTVKVGDIFHWSWGYDQTNCDYYQVVEKRGKQIILREICGQMVPGSEGFMSCSMVAVPDSFKEKGETLIKLAQAFKPGDRPYISMEFGWCGLWDGKPDYCSWYA
jgi:hypothetical protein